MIAKSQNKYINFKFYFIKFQPTKENHSLNLHTHTQNEEEQKMKKL